MNILLALLPVSLLLLGVAIVAFLWAVRRGQFDDLDTPPLDILGDDALPRPPQSASADGRGTAPGDDAAPAGGPDAPPRAGPDRDDFDAPPDGSGGAGEGR